MPKVNKPKSTDIQKQLAEKLQALRQQKDVSQSEIAKYIELSVGAYQNYENGRREANYETLCKLADFYNVSTDYLLGRTSVKHMATEQPDPLADVDISDVEKRAIMRYTALDETMRAVCIEAFRQISGVLITEDGEVKQSSEKSKQKKLTIKFAPQIPQLIIKPPEQVLPFKPDIQIPQMRNSELAVLRGGNGMCKPVPTDEQLSTMEEVTPDMLGE